jgi:hypothetical protein
MIAVDLPKILADRKDDNHKSAIYGLGSNIGHGLFVGWVEHPDFFCWVSFLNPTYVLKRNYLLKSHHVCT